MNDQLRKLTDEARQAARKAYDKAINLDHRIESAVTCLLAGDTEGAARHLDQIEEEDALETVQDGFEEALSSLRDALDLAEQ